MKKCKHVGCSNPVKTPTTRNGGNWKPTKYLECNPCIQYKQKYGLTTPEVQEILDRQGGGCKICKKPLELGGKTGNNRAMVDHQEMPFKVRGVLCVSCNTGLGKLGDCEEGLMRALKYVRDEL